MIPNSGNKTSFWQELFMNTRHLRCHQSLQWLCRLSLGFPLNVQSPVSHPLPFSLLFPLCTSFYFHAVSFGLSFQGQFSCVFFWLPAPACQHLQHWRPLHICRLESLSTQFPRSSHKSNLYIGLVRSMCGYRNQHNGNGFWEGWHASGFSYKAREEKIGFLFSRVVLNHGSHAH